jgi:hypothetical protein
MVFYEFFQLKIKEQLGSEEKFKENEVFNVIKASLISGCSTALLTNFMEVIVIRR